ncbi:cytochrome P450 734A1-like isoform X2 [Tasmannia lanceolata]|uniref:cytochrome P450 734A1-like isoform X2 n=1 Tax=Tasmannia lanceolata TaxID=3420 RepID=UPI0040633999
MPFVHEILHRASPFYDYWSKLYGKMFVYWFGSTPGLTIADLDLIKEVLLNKSGVIEKVAYDPITKQLFGDGMLSVHGEKWARHRKIGNAAFNMERVKKCVPTITDCTRNMLDKWEREGGESSEFEIEVHVDFQDFAADVISKTAFGSSFEEGKRIFQLQDEQIVLVSHAQKRVYIPGYRFVPTKENIRLWRLDREIRQSFRKLIENNGKVGENKKNLLGSFISANKSQKKEERIGVEELIGECKTFYFAGKETTANLLTWTLLLLGSDQEWQSKAREEVLHLYGRHQIPTANTLNQLKIVGMIIDEALRLYPPVPTLLREVHKNITLGKLHVPAGTQLYIPLIAVHHSVEIWGEDAEKFNPSRSPEMGRHLAAFFPFALGPRTCVGQNLGIVEAKIALAMTLQRFSFTVSPTYAHAPVYLLTIQPQHGAHLIFQKI